MSSSQDGVKEFKGDYSLVPDGSSSWINYVSVSFLTHLTIRALYTNL